MPPIYLHEQLIYSLNSKSVELDLLHGQLTTSSTVFPIRSCELHPIPTWLLKMCVDELAPVITKMVNLSLHEGLVPDSWEVALMVLLLKKVNLKPTFSNSRPVSNLSFTSKTLERLVIQQLLVVVHCSDNAPLPNNQSSYRKFHSTETCPLRVHNDILMSMDRQ